MTRPPFDSYARNGEDVVLWRALGGSSPGRFIEVRAADPGAESTTRALAERGWTGATLTADADLEGALQAAGDELAVLAVADPAVLARIDLHRRRPWIVVVTTDGAATETWEPAVLAAGYELCLFDGASRYYLDPAHAELRERLDHGACVLDGYTTPAERDLVEQLAAARAEANRWRTAALERWSEEMVGATPYLDLLREHNRLLKTDAEAIRQTLSWRVTKPIRGLRTLAGALTSRR